MAASPVVTENLGSMGNKAARIVTITFDNSYAAGGEAITANACGLSNITSLIPLNTTGGYIPVWDQTNLKVLMTRPGLRSISQTCAVSAMTDGGSTSGYIDFTTPLPIGAVPVSSQFDCTVAFSGDTSAVWKLGISGDLDRYSTTTTNSCFTAIKTSSLTKTTGLSATNAVQTPRLTITTGADFTTVFTAATATGIATLFYLNSAGSLTGEETAAVDLSAVAVTALVLGTP